MITLPAAEVALLHSVDLILIEFPYVSSKFHLFDNHAHAALLLCQAPKEMAPRTWDLKPPVSYWGDPAMGMQKPLF